jgi:hypothetical protein
MMTTPKSNIGDDSLSPVVWSCEVIVLDISIVRVARADTLHIPVPSMVLIAITYGASQGNDYTS